MRPDPSTGSIWKQRSTVTGTGVISRKRKRKAIQGTPNIADQSPMKT